MDVTEDNIVFDNNNRSNEVMSDFFPNKGNIEDILLLK